MVPANRWKLKEYANYGFYHRERQSGKAIDPAAPDPNPFKRYFAIRCILIPGQASTTQDKSQEHHLNGCVRRPSTFAVRS